MRRTWTRRRFARFALGLGAVWSAGSLRPRTLGAAARPKVVVVGGGAGGASLANNLAARTERIEVTLINNSPSYTTCFFANPYIAGLRSFRSITHDYEGLKKRSGIEVVVDLAIGVDPEKREVILAGDSRVPYDRLVIAPGIDFRYDAIDGYSPDAAEIMPHAWRGGAQLSNLRAQLEAMEDGGTFVVCPPQAPYRCPPAPYERVSLVAHYLMRHKPRSTILVIDAKSEFGMQALFEEAWARFYPDMIEWLPAEMTNGGIKAVNLKHRQVLTDDEAFEASVANVIPPQVAGPIAQAAGLADESGWCPIDPSSFASRLVPHVYVVGDAAIGDEMPKSAYSANTQAKACADALLVDLLGESPGTADLRNRCWSFLGPDHAVQVGADYAATADHITKTHSFISEVDEDDALRARTAEDARAWYANITQDMFG